MKYYIRTMAFLLVCTLVLGTVGCGSYAAESSRGTDTQGAKEQIPEQNRNNQIISMEETPVIHYTVPQSTPNILVGLQGYCVGENKEAIVKGKKLPRSFQVRKRASGKVVYSGTIENVSYDEKQGLSIGYIDFSEVDIAGEYYIGCDIVGHSKAFEIRENLYEVLLEEVYQKVIERGEGKLLTISEALMVMQVYEWYMELFPDEDGDNKPDVLIVLQKWVSHMEESGVEKGQEALYATFLAKFSYHFQKLDYKYATDCLQRAFTVYGQVQETQTNEADIFYALAELYRATDHNQYRKQILGYKSYFKTNSIYPERREYIYGGLTYLVTRRSVDKELCEAFIHHVLARGEEIAGCYEELIHPVSASNHGTEELIKRAIELSCANYVLNNYQYTNIIEEFLHYLMGRNLDSVDFYESEDYLVEYLMLLAQLVDTKKALE